MTPTELLDEAGDEEDNNVHRRKRKIKARLLKYKKYMLDKELSYNYMLVNYSRIKKFYTINEIKVPDTIRISRPKNEPEPSDEASEGIPSLEMWQEALEYCSPKWKGIITLATSSGMGAAEVMLLTYNQWLDAISCKHLTQDEETSKENMLIWMS
jgi:hypothetical protein